LGEPLACRVRGDGVELQLYEWAGDGRPILLAHATGFHARCWDQVVAHLPGRHVYAVDMRGHGLSDKPEPPYDWRAFGRDVAAVARELDLAGAIGAGHSKGGYAITRAAAEEPGAFAALLLVDPVIMPSEMYRQTGPAREHFPAKRRNHFASPAEMEERFRGRAPFDRWGPAVLHDYCQYGLVPDPHGHGYVLACPPEVEASTYGGALDSGDIYDDVAKITVPVRVLRAGQRDAGGIGMNGSPTFPGLAACFKDGEDVPVAGMSHLMAMEDPALIARHILELEERIR